MNMATLVPLPVVLPLLGAFAWDQPGFTDVSTDVYVSDLRQVRRPLLFGGGDDDDLSHHMVALGHATREKP